MTEKIDGLLDGTLYKYRDMSRYTLEIFINKQIFLPISSMFNDPFDAQIRPQDYIRELRINNPNIDQDAFKAQDDFVTERLKHMGIYSLSRNHDNILMWSHYADSHRGLCIGFAPNLTHHLSNYDYPIYLRDVLYEEKHPYFETLERKLSKSYYNSDDEFSNTIECNLDLLFAGLTIKHQCWNYEREVRLMAEYTGLQDIKPSAIREIIFGLCMSEGDKSTIRSLLSTNEWSHVKLKQAVKGQALLSIDIVDA
ncbi:DUF2971 domain-containing protein [Vibrio maritimus]